MSLANHILPSPVFEEYELNPWQEALHDSLIVDADDRSISFFVDEAGGKGKTYFCRYMLSKYPDRVQVLGLGKRDDLAFAVDVSKCIFLFNIPRSGMEHFQYSVVEMIKDRLIFSPKYASLTKVLSKNVHVVVFCNEYPDREKLSTDRYIITEL